MAVKENIIITVTAESKKAVKDMLSVQKASKLLANAEKQRKKSSDDVAKSQADVAEGAKQMAEALGGRAGSAVGVVEKLIRGMGALGPAAGIAGAGLVGVGLGAIALVGSITAAIKVTTAVGTAFANATLDARAYLDELEALELGHLNTFDAETIASVEAAALALDVAGRSASKFGVVLSAETAPAVESVALLASSGFANMAEGITFLSDEVLPPLNSAIDALQEKMSVFGGVTDLMLGSFGGFVSALDRTIENVDELRESQAEVIAETIAVTEATKETTVAVKDEAAAYRELMLDMQAIAAFKEKYADFSEKVQLQVEAATVESEGRILALHDENETREEARISRKVERSKKTSAELFAADLQQVEGAFAQADAVTNAFGQLSDGLLQDAIETQAGLGEQGQKNAKKLFAVQKAADLGRAITAGAMATVQALGSAPPPVSFVLAGLTAAAAGVSIGKIAATKPSFHIGTRASDLAPDESLAKVTRREEVITPLGREALAAANANAGVSGGGGVVFQMGHDFFSAGVKAATTPGSTFARSMGRTKVGHRKRRG